MEAWAGLPGGAQRTKTALGLADHLVLRAEKEINTWAIKSPQGSVDTDGTRVSSPLQRPHDLQFQQQPFMWI